MDNLGLIHLLRRSVPARVATVALTVVVLAGITTLLFHELFQLRGLTSAGGTFFAGHVLIWGIGAIGLAIVIWGRTRILRAHPLSFSWCLALDAVLMVAYALTIAPLSLPILYRTVGAPDTVALAGHGLLPVMLARAMVTYAAVLLCLTSLRNYIHLRDRRQADQERQFREESLKAQLATARLDALRSQLHPHFLFNALHAIGGLVIEGEPRAAHRAIAALASLLRHSIRHGDEPTVSVRDEVRLIEEYFSLEKLRLGERLRTHTHVAPEAEHDAVPALLLLPVVENAIRHGIAPRPSGGTVSVRVTRCAAHIQITVEDDGVGVNANRDGASTEEGGVGLANCMERVGKMYGDDGSLSIEDVESGGTRVTVRVPLHASDPVPHVGGRP